MKFYQILVTDVFRLVDVLIRFWYQKVKDQGHQGLVFGIKGSKVMVIAGSDPKTL